MDNPDTPPLVDIKKADIDHVNITAPYRSRIAQVLSASTPLLTVFITAVGVVFTLCFNIYQTKEQTQQKADSDWRAALEKVSLDQNTSAIGAFEMQSFLSDPNHKKQARSIASAILPAVVSRDEFQVALDNLIDDTTQKNQEDVITLAHSVSIRFQALYDSARKQTKDASLLKDMTLQNFVQDPDSYLTGNAQAADLEQARTDNWELDSVIHALSWLWGPRGKGFAPKDADLDGIIFLNGDFSGVDFRQASTEGTYFVGSCVVTDAKFPIGEKSPECVPKN